MPMSREEIESLIKEALPDAAVMVSKLADDDDHFAARVVSAQFRGLSRVQQHHPVYSALKGRFGGVLHALALETALPK